ncbi:MAG: glycosyltransferase [bacterium]|nr:glycosyltransferase [bacterium]
MGTATPLISIVLPLYNGRRYVAETLASIAAQSEQSAELIVVDDGSTDDSAALVEEICRGARAPILQRLSLIRQENQGVAAARNAGIARARGTWIAFVDQDDLWSAHKLATQLRALESTPGAQWHYSAFVRFYEDGREVVQNKGSADRLVTWRRLLGGELFIPPATAMVARAACEAIGGFDVTLSPTDDWDFFLKLVAQYDVCYSPECLVRFRSHPYSAGKRQRQRIFTLQREVLARHAPVAAGHVPEKVIRRRRANIAWHLGREAMAEGQVRVARTWYRRALADCPWRVKCWRSYVVTWLPGPLRRLLTPPLGAPS